MSGICLGEVSYTGNDEEIGILTDQGCRIHLVIENLKAFFNSDSVAVFARKMSLYAGDDWALRGSDDAKESMATWPQWKKDAGRAAMQPIPSWD